jgi:hypothetical protein
MDPNQALQEIREVVDAILGDDSASDLPEKAASLAERVTALDVWISRGGFLPGPWRGRQDALGSDPGLAAPLEFSLHSPDMKLAWEGAHGMCRHYFGDVAYVLRADKAELIGEERNEAGELLATMFNIQFYAYVEQQVIVDA